MVQATPEVTCPPEHEHGPTCYGHHGCRCTRCRGAIAQHRYWHRHMRAVGKELPTDLVEATGTRRRLDALMRAGWSYRAMSAMLDVHYTLLPQWRESERVFRRTAQTVADLYARIAYAPPPQATRGEKYAYSRTVNTAIRRGYLPPAAWDDIDHDPEPPAPDESRVAFDHAVVELAIMGHKPTLTPDEREDVVRRLHRRRWSDTTIANYIGSNSETVLRIRQRIGLRAWEKAELLWHEKDAA